MIFNREARAHELEKHTGKTSSEILEEIQNGEARIKELESRKKNLETDVDNLKLKEQAIEENLRNKESRLDAEYEEKLKQHSLRVEEIEQISTLTKSLKDFGLELTQLEKLQPTLVKF